MLACEKIESDVLHKDDRYDAQIYNGFRHGVKPYNSGSRGFSKNLG